MWWMALGGTVVILMSIGLYIGWARLLKDLVLSALYPMSYGEDETDSRMIMWKIFPWPFLSSTYCIVCANMVFKTNKNRWKGHAKGTLLFLGVNGECKSFLGFRYWVYQFTFTHDFTKEMFLLPGQFPFEVYPEGEFKKLGWMWKDNLILKLIRRLT